MGISSLRGEGWATTKQSHLINCIAWQGLLCRKASVCIQGTKKPAHYEPVSQNW